MRFGKKNVDEYFNNLWASKDDPPWVVADQPIELDKIRLLLPHVRDARSVLDCGCGGGDFLSMLARHVKFERVVGIDVADNALDRARRTGCYSTLLRGQIDDVVQRVDETFDLAILSDVLYYLTDHTSILCSVLETAISPRGIVFISVAVGREYYLESEIGELRAVLSRRGYAPLVDQPIDYMVLGVARRKLPFARAYAQTHKAVLVYQRRG